MTANTTNSQAARTEDLAKEWAELHMTLEDWRNRAIAAESRLAEIQRGVEGLTRWMETFEDGLCQAIRNDPPSNDVFVRLTSVLTLFAHHPTGCTHDCNQGRDCTCK